jgi:hypothetical protein
MRNSLYSETRHKRESCKNNCQTMLLHTITHYMARHALNCWLLILSSWILVGPHFFLQLGAWSWMLVTYSQESNLRIGFQQTFSGERPCGMCKAIQATDNSDTKSPIKATAPADELRLFLVIANPLKLAPMETSIRQTLAHTQSAGPRYTKVPTPPPKQIV